MNLKQWFVFYKEMNKHKYFKQFESHICIIMMRMDQHLFKVSCQAKYLLIDSPIKLLHIYRHARNCIRFINNSRNER